MITFKQFIGEGQKSGKIYRNHPVMYSSHAPDTNKDTENRFHSAFRELSQQCGLPRRFGSETMHVQTYATAPGQSYDRLFTVTLGFPDGDDPEDADMFATLVTNAFKKKFNVLRVLFKNKSRAFWKTQDEFIESMERRKGKKVTAGDAMEIEVGYKL